MATQVLYAVWRGVAVGATSASEQTVEMFKFGMQRNASGFEAWLGISSESAVCHGITMFWHLEAEIVAFFCVTCALLNLGIPSSLLIVLKCVGLNGLLRIGSLLQVGMITNC